jgi:hypothetical protein
MYRHTTHVPARHTCIGTPHMYRHATHVPAHHTCIGTPHMPSSGSLCSWHHNILECVQVCHSEWYRLSYNGPFESIVTVTTETP